MSFRKPASSGAGAWPHMRFTTLKGIVEELQRARAKHPEKNKNLEILLWEVGKLQEELRDHDAGKVGAVQIFARGVELIVMTIRLIEEGTSEHRYADYVKNPPFKLEP